ncbi:GNAT family N-acetyltransferase [Bacillus sp. MMSF_3328]|uniref:GNAT family N-acetyltransferase n=1 Tax=Bacillus TaxID=1386 RepID=UPI00273EE342|nr:GNAT family N-acetyltransferase [Bacillus sp. MMSF_3328]
MLSFRSIDLSRDAETIIKFRRDSYVISFGDDYLFGDNKSYLKKIETRLVKFPGGIVLVENGDKPVGQIEMQIKDIDNKQIGYVNLFYLIPAYRGLGYGSQLIEYAEHFFQENNINEYQLRVSAANKRAIRFYKKQGFNSLRIEEEGTVPRIRMQKLL